MKYIKQMLIGGVILCTSFNASPFTLHICGDSTAAYWGDWSPIKGWGQYIESYFDSDITIANHAKHGHDVKTFYNSPDYWPAIKSMLEPGDYVLLQYGHNDASNGGIDGEELYNYYIGTGNIDKAEATNRCGTEPSRSYVDILSRLVNEIRDRGAIPVLASPTARMGFVSARRISRNARHDLGDNFSCLTADGTVTGCKIPAYNHSMDYRYQMMKLAEENDVLFIDVTEACRQIYESIGKTQTLKYFSTGLDTTHFGEQGARSMALLHAELLQNINGLGEHIILEGLSVMSAFKDMEWELEAMYDIYGRRIDRPVQGVNIVVSRNSAGDILVEKTWY
ncbi:MAG: carbohydrate esterase [Muribaculaceae bacterium]|nr:carbohydrate esterase [Muribaculaceae bacterium]